MSGVEIRVRSNSTQARKDLSQLERSIQNIDRTTAGVTRTFRNLALSITAAFSAVSVSRSLTTAADSIANLSNRIALVTGRGDELQSTMTDLYSIAARARVPVNSSADVFNRFGLALQNTGVSSSDLLTVTEAVSKAVTISGSSAESAQAALIQLGQGLASGQLRGQELNSVLEQTPRLARAIADGIGIPFGQLRAAAEEGLLTTDAVFNAIIGQFDVIESEFNILDATVESLIVTLRDELTRALSALDVELGFSNAVKNGIIVATNALRFFADNLNSFVTVTQADFRILLNNLILFKEEVKDNLTNIFTFDSGINLENFNSSLEAISSAYDEKLGYLTDPIVLKIQEINLSQFIPSLDEVKSKIIDFILYIEDWFIYLYYAIAGDSWWGEIFWEGPNRIGGPKFTEALDSVQQKLSTWSESIANYFEILYTKVSTSWNNLLNALTNRTIETPSGPQVVRSELGQFIDKALESGGTIYIDVTERADNLVESLTNRTIETPSGPQVVRSEFGQFSDSINKLVNEGLPSFDSIVENLSLAIAGLRNAPIIKSLSASIAGISEYSKSGKVAASGFIEGILNNKESIAVLFAGALFLATKIGLKRFTLVATSVAFAPEILNSPTFQKSARFIAEGFGQILGQIISGEGDYGAKVLEGLSQTFVTIGDGIIDGIFGEENDFTGKFTDGLIGAITVGLLAFTLVPALRKAALSVVSSLVKVLFGSSFSISLFSNGIVGALNALAAGNVLQSLTSGTWSGFAKGLGIIFARSIRGGVLGYFASQGTNLLLDALFTNILDRDLTELESGLVDVISGAVGGATAGAMIAGPWGALIGGIAGALFSAFTNPAVMQAIRDLPNILYDGLEGLGDFIVEKFNNSVDGVKNWVSNIKDELLNALTNAWNEFFGIRNEVEITVSGNSEAIYLDPESYLIQNRANGGYISGSGGPTDDKIPAMLSNGEFVIKASSVDKFGTGFFNSLNNGNIPKFANGGQIGNESSTNNDVVGLLLNGLIASSGLNGNTRIASYLGALLTTSDFAPGSSAYDATLSYLFNSTNSSERLNNLFSGKANNVVYDIINGAMLNAIENSIIGMGLGTLAGTPGIGTILGLLASGANTSVELIQGGSRGLRHAGFYSSAPSYINNALYNFEEGQTLTDFKRAILETPKSVLDSVTGWASNGLNSFVSWLGRNNKFADGGYVNLKNNFEKDFNTVSNIYDSYGVSLKKLPIFPSGDFTGFFKPLVPTLFSKNSAIEIPNYLEDNNPQDIAIAYHELGHAIDFLSNLQDYSNIDVGSILISKHEAAAVDFIENYRNGSIEEETFANAYMIPNLERYGFLNEAKSTANHSMNSYIFGDMLSRQEESEFANAAFPNSTSLSALDTAGYYEGYGFNNFKEKVSESLDFLNVLPKNFINPFFFDFRLSRYFSEFFSWLNNGENNNNNNLSNSLSQIFNSLKNDVKGFIPKFASGGAVFGSGGPTDDKIPAMLSNGEYVIKANSVKRFGIGFFNALNNGMLPGFNKGGYVTQYDSRIENLTATIEKLRAAGNNQAAIERSQAILDDLLQLRNRAIIELYGDPAADLEERSTTPLSEGSSNANNPPRNQSVTPQQTPGQSFAENFARDFESGLVDALSTGDFKSFGLMLLDSFTMGIISSFSQGITDALFKGLIGNTGSDGPLSSLFSGVMNWGSNLASGVGESVTDGLTETISSSNGLFSNISNLFSKDGFFGSLFSGLLGSGGGGGLFSSLFGLSFGGFLGFNTGGLVPSISTSRTDIDSVPAMLTPGELVVPADKVKDFQNNNNKQTIVNLSITGDISRQTKKEIMGMIPQIAAGVNMTNRENNFR